MLLREGGGAGAWVRTLEQLGQRAGRPVECVLADPGGVSDEAKDGLVELESLLAHGQYQNAIELGQKLLSLGSSAHLLGPIRYHLARAYLQQGKPEPARDLLKQASAHFESVGG